MRFCLYDAGQLDDVLERMAARAIALLNNANNPHLVGILRRGEPLARFLQQRILAHTGKLIPMSALKLKRYADDLTLLHPETELTASAEIDAMDFRDKTVLLVDDVLYQGHSLLRAICHLSGHGCREIRTAVLVDRQVRTLPVVADIAGITLRIAAGDVVECSVPPYEQELRIDICRYPR